MTKITPDHAGFEKMKPVLEKMKPVAERLKVEVLQRLAGSHDPESIQTVTAMVMILGGLMLADETQGRRRTDAELISAIRRCFL